MTIASTVTKKIYDADGVTRDWPITMETSGISSSEIKVYLVDEDGVSTLVTANYDVDLTALSVEYPTVVSGLDPIASPNKILLVRELALTQPTDYKNQGDVPAETIEEGLDRLTEVAQQLQEQVDRSVKSDISENSGLDYDDFVAVKADCDAAQAAAEVAQGLAEDAQASAEAVLTDAGFVAVAADLIGDDNIGTVADSISDVNDVADNVIAIAAVNANETNINAVNANKTNIDAVAANATNINAVNTNKTNIDAVAGNATNINAVATNAANINTVAGDTADINTVADNIADVNTVADNIATIASKVSGDGTVNPTNLLSNGDFEAWSAGASAAPDGWTLYSGNVARESSEIDSGTYSAKMVRAGTDCGISQSVHAAKGINYWKGKNVTISVRTKSTQNNSSAYVSDGVGATVLSTYTGGTGWQTIQCTRTIDANATGITLYLQSGTADGTYYFDGAICVEGSSAFAFSPKPAEEGVWADYSAVSTIVGWSAFTTKQIYTKKTGKTVFVSFDIGGTSDATGASFTVPYTCNASIGERFYIISQDNVTWSANGGNGSITASGNTVDAYLTGVPGGAWTASGTKRIIGSFSYEAT